ncbi:unnamed protein product, partial [Prorocentrum cordatum]
MNQIPILLIGKPGCSKSLAMGILQSNLNGQVSSKEFFKSMPAVDVFPYQCSPLSTPEAILGAFESARQSNLGHKSTIVCVLLDEVGLAEESPHLPLKVLHRELEDLQGIACVGISNWSLDAAKMSRFVTLYRPPATVEDLRVTAEGMVASANLRGYLKALSEAFFDVYRTQGRPDFWGMREFYSTVRVVHAELRDRAARGGEAALEPQVLLRTVQRNFGGRPASELDACVRKFFGHTGMSERHVPRFTTLELVGQNLREPEARHLMLLTKNNAALRMLFDSRLCDHSRSEVMFGSTFPDDQSDVVVAMNLQKIKTFMMQPISLVLVHCDLLYESLYDLLNQHYMEYAGQRYVRIAHGSKAKQCPIHHLFRVVVITEISDAYFRLAPPLLNRFEKQIFVRRDLMTKPDEALLSQLQRFWELLASAVLESAGGAAAGEEQPSEAAEAGGGQVCVVVGHHRELLSSLVFALKRGSSGSERSIDELLGEAKRLLAWVMTPEAICIVAARHDARQMQHKFGFNLVTEYFDKQQHTDLPSFASRLLEDSAMWCDSMGAQVMIMTYSPLRGAVRAQLGTAVPGSNCSEVSLHEFSSSQDVEKAVRRFYSGGASRSAAAGGKHFLLIHADPVATSLRMIEHCRFVCDKARTVFFQDSGSKGPAISLFVLLVVHLRRGHGVPFSFDFDSQWSWLRPPFEDLDGMPALRDMLGKPLLQVVPSTKYNFRTKIATAMLISDAVANHVFAAVGNHAFGYAINGVKFSVEYWIGRCGDDDMMNSYFRSVLIVWALTSGSTGLTFHALWAKGFRAIVRSKVVRGLDFERLLRGCFRGSLSRLVYPHSRGPEDLQGQIGLLLRCLADKEFISRTTPKNPSSAAEGTVGHDQAWFAAVAAATHGLALAGTLRNALHGRVVSLVSSLLAVMLAHLDRNGGLALLEQKHTRPLWLSLAAASLGSPLSAQLGIRAVQALSEPATAQHEVGTDAKTGARPFEARFPSSWFVSRSVDGARHIVDSLPPQEQLPALLSQYKLSQLHEAGLQPVVGEALLSSYIGDFAAMNLHWTERVDRSTQQRVLTKALQRFLMHEQGRQKLDSILQVHQVFWSRERQIDFVMQLLNAVPTAVAATEKLIEAADLNTFNLDILLLAHTTLIDELRSPGPAGAGGADETKQIYRNWLERKMVVASLRKDVLQQQQANGKLDALAQLKTDKEPRLETLALVLQHVAIPFKLPLQLVKQFLLELPDRKVRQSASLLAILQMAQRVSGSEFPGALCEDWLLDVCLRDTEAREDLDDGCLGLACALAAGLPVTVNPRAPGGVSAGDVGSWNEQQEPGIDLGIATLPGRAGAVPRSSCFSLALMRKLLLGAPGGRARQRAAAAIEGLLREVEAKEGHCDTALAARYAACLEEESAAALSQAKGPQEWPELTLQGVFAQGEGASLAHRLQDIGRIRWMLARCSRLLCQSPVDKEAYELCMARSDRARVDGLLHTSDRDLVPVSRSMRLYLLKCIERARGVSFARGLLAEPPLGEANWVHKWRGAHDIDFEKFIGAALVPKWNPFIGEDGSEEYKTAKGALTEMMISHSIEKLERLAREIGAHPEEQRKRDLGGLLLALCQGPGLHSALESPGRHSPWRKKLNAWLAETTDLAVSTQERILLRIFAGDDAPLRSCASADQESLAPFAVSGGRSMDDLLRWRWLAHLASACISAPPTSLLAALTTIMLSPRCVASADGGAVYLPGMDEDIRKSVMKALLDRGESIWRFKSHWYKCACGYSFFIGECGRPMEVAECPGCRAHIGGQDHHKTKNTSEDDEADRSPAGYVLPPAEKDEKSVCFREVPVGSARAVRLLLHGFCGVACHLGGKSGRIYQHLVNPDSMCPMKEGGESEAKFLGDHFRNDWEQMATNLSMALHMLLQSMAAQAVDAPVARSGGAASSTAGRPGGATRWDRFDMERRDSWEATLESAYLADMVRSHGDRTRELHQRWGGAAEDGRFVAELMETVDVRDFSKALRRSSMPQLWSFREPVTLASLGTHVGVEANAKDSLPVLCAVLQQPLGRVLPALGCLVGIFEWHALVASHFSGRITRTQAGQMVVGEVIEGLPSALRVRWQRAFRRLELAWRIAWPSVQRHECLEIPEHLRNVKLGLHSSMVYCIADEKNEGICPLALTQWLVERHNELVQIVGNATGYPGKKVSSRMLALHDVVVYSEEELMRFVRSRCVTYSGGGKLKFDFSQVERHLRQELARPALEMEMRAFGWLGESLAVSGELRATIAQRGLSHAVEERIRSELTSPAMAGLVLQKVQMTVSFLLKCGGSLRGDAGEMLLGEYMRSVLSEDAAVGLPSAALRSEVRLCHVDALASLLKGVLNKDPMEGVDPRYRAELPPALEAELVAARPRLPAALAPLLARFAEGHLADASLSGTASMLDMFAAMEELI